MVVGFGDKVGRQPSVERWQVSKKTWMSGIVRHAVLEKSTVGRVIGLVLAE